MEGSLTLTPKALEKVRYFGSQSEQAKGKSLRVYIQGGGCSGFSYGFTFDDKREGDLEIETSGVKVLVDPKSLPYLAGAEVDFVEDLNSSGFSVKNPNAKGSCGCGQSFQV